MDGKQNPKNIQTNVYTNSIIELNLPPADQLPKNIGFEWKSASNGCYLTSHRYFPSGQKANTYHVSPLDYDSIITVNVKDLSSNHLYQTIEYGPVKLQPKIYEVPEDFKPCYQVGVALSNYFVKNAILKLKKDKQSLQVQIKIEEKQILNIKLLRKLSNRPLLKVYEGEANALGIYVYHQYDKLKQILKNLKIWAHYGYYLKVILPDRLSRDILIFDFLRKTGLQIQGLTGLKNNQLEARTSCQKESIQEERPMNETGFLEHFQFLNQEEKNQSIYFQKNNFFNSQTLSEKRKTQCGNDSGATTNENNLCVDEEENLKKKFGSIIIEEPNYGRKLIDIRRKKAKQTQQKEEKEIFKNLLIEYKRLKHQNLDLKQENERLKSQSQKEDKMLQIKQLIFMMAKRLQYLESMQVKKKQLKVKKQQNNTLSYEEMKNYVKMKINQTREKRIISNRKSQKFLTKHTRKFYPNHTQLGQGDAYEHVTPKSVSPVHSHPRMMQDFI